MTTIKNLMDIEDILLRADNDLRYSYSLNEVIKSEKFLKEIGEITNLFLSLQIEFGKINDTKDKEYKQKLVDYHNKLISDQLDVDTTKYVSFIQEISERLKNKDYYDKVKKILTI